MDASGKYERNMEWDSMGSDLALRDGYCVPVSVREIAKQLIQHFFALNATVALKDLDLDTAFRIDLDFPSLTRHNHIHAKIAVTVGINAVSDARLFKLSLNREEFCEPRVLAHAPRSSPASARRIRVSVSSTP